MSSRVPWRCRIRQTRRSRFVCPTIRARTAGSIVNISSRAGVDPSQRQGRLALYAMAKTGIIQYTRSLQSLVRILPFMGYPSASTRTWLMIKNYVVAMDPELARGLSKSGYTKKDLKQWLYDNARNQYAEFSQAERKA
ncbi:MAG: SDR family NAD(P)-dependent oxidoreductase, partial [Giesbergeria sp.]